MSQPPPERLVLDADVVSFLFNQDPIRTPRYEAHLQGRTLYLPFAAISEIWYGVEIRQWGLERRERLERHLRRYRTVHSDEHICANWVAIRARGRREGRPIEPQDAWVAAVAVTLDLPLVTHNAAHFAHIPMLRIITEPDR